MAVDSFFERIDYSALHNTNGKEQACQHGPTAEAAAPSNEQAGQDKKRHPKIQAGEHGPRLVQPRPSPVGVEKEEQLLVERRKHVW